MLMGLLYAMLTIAMCGTAPPPILVSTPTPEITATVEPTVTPEPSPIPSPTPSPLTTTFTATRYGESYNGQQMGCVGSGLYDSNNPVIFAAPPARYAQFPCGTKLNLCYQDRCQEMWRVDSCPGCGPNHVDLSEAGIWYLCAWRCDILNGVQITILELPVPNVVAPSAPSLTCRSIIAIREVRCR